MIIISLSLSWVSPATVAVDDGYYLDARARTRIIKAALLMLLLLLLVLLLLALLLE